MAEIKDPQAFDAESLEMLATDGWAQTYGDPGVDRWMAGVEQARGARCESGWTGDRCQRPLFHDGQHDND